MSVLVLILTAGAIILLVRFGLVVGIDRIADALHWSAKARGQATGFATSTPELVALTAAGLSGVWDAGLWNIASSNIINTVLMLTAVLWYRQVPEVLDRRFFDELAFAALAVVVPIVLMTASLDEHWAMLPVLVGFFVVYRFFDRRANRPDPADRPEHVEQAPAGSLAIGLILVVTMLAAIAVVGMFLGEAAEEVVHQLGVHPAAAGWMLGLVTSLPEMITFFAVYGASKKAGKLDSRADTQEALDNLTASNMANVGVVYPLGLAAYLLVTAV